MSPEETEVMMTAVSGRLADLESKIDKVLAICERVETLASTVAGQVKPVLDDLMKSPLLKMLGVKSK